MKELEIDGKKIFITEESVDNYRDEHLLYLLDKCYDLVEKGSRSALKVVLRAVKKYPRIPRFRNLLAIAYGNIGLEDKAYDVARKTEKMFPDYFYGKVNLAEILLDEEEPDFEYINQLLGGDNKSILTLSPDTDTFYVKDFYDYYRQYVILEAKQGNREGVEKAIEPLLAFFGEEHPSIIKLGTWASAVVFSKGMATFNSYDLKLVESFSVFTLEQTNKRPELTHDELYNLYDYSIEEFPVDLMERILNLPRVSLIEDLERILYDSIRRFEWFQEDENEKSSAGEKWSGDFPMSAMYFMAGLEANEKLDSVLNVLRQGEVFLEFWFGDFVSEYMEPVIYLLGKDQLDVLQKLTLDPNVWWLAKSLVFNVMVQVAIQDETKREEVIQRIIEVVEYIIGHADDKSLFDTNLFSSLMAGALDMRATELVPLIEDLFERGWVDSRVAGDLEEIKLEIVKPFDSFYKRNIPEDIFDVFAGRYNERDNKLLDEDTEKLFLPEASSRASNFLTKMLLNKL